MTQKKSELLERVKVLEKRLGFIFSNRELLLEALCHPSFWNENQGLLSNHQERLEFLGDAVLELLVSEYLFHRFPDLSEGELTQKRALLVRTESLAYLARVLRLQDLVLLGRGERENHREDGKAFKSILSNTFEAVLGALWLEVGYEGCRRFLIPLIELLEEENRASLKDPKSELQEVTQKYFKEKPEYVVLQEEGPDHAKRFKVGVYLKGKLLGTGEGASKQEAEKRAAQKALQTKEAWLENVKDKVSEER